MISFYIEGCSPLSKKPESTFIFDYSRANYEGLCDYLFDSDLNSCLQSNSIEQIWSFLKETIHRGLHLFIPTVRVTPKVYSVWFNREIHHTIKCLHTQRRKCLKFPTHYNHSKLCSLESRLKDLTSSAIPKFEHQLASRSPSRIFRYIKTSPLVLQCLLQCPWTPPLDQMLATRFLFLTLSSTQYSPLVHFKSLLWKSCHYQKQPFPTLAFLNWRCLRPYLLWTLLMQWELTESVQKF